MKDGDIVKPVIFGKLYAKTGTGLAVASTSNHSAIPSSLAVRKYEGGMTSTATAPFLAACSQEPSRLINAGSSDPEHEFQASTARGGSPQEVALLEGAQRRPFAVRACKYDSGASRRLEIGHQSRHRCAVHFPFGSHGGHSSRVHARFEHAARILGWPTTLNPGPF